MVEEPSNVGKVWSMAHSRCEMMPSAKSSNVVLGMLRNRPKYGIRGSGEISARARKRQQDQAQLAAKLQVGDRVITWSGIYGEIVSADADTIVLKVESGATIRMARMAVAQKQPESSK